MKKEDFTTLQNLVSEYYEIIKTKPENKNFLGYVAKTKINNFVCELEEVNVWAGNCYLRASMETSNYNNQFYTSFGLYPNFTHYHSLSTAKDFQNEAEQVIKHLNILENCGMKEYMAEIEKFNETLMIEIKSKIVSEVKRIIETKIIKSTKRQDSIYITIKKDEGKELFPTFTQCYDYKRNGTIDEVCLDIAKSALYWFRKGE